jgi:hypothetical protein
VVTFLQQHPYCVNCWHNDNGYIGFDFDKSINGLNYHIVIAISQNQPKHPIFWQCLEIGSLTLLELPQTPEWFQELVQTLHLHM